MVTFKNMALGPQLVLASMLLATSAAAQDPIDDDLLPAVDTSAQGLASGESRDDVSEPRAGAETPPVSGDVSRSITGDQVMDTIELGRTEITGNQELPKVLYIVPWKKSDPGDLMGKPVNSLLDEVLAPIDREEFRRQVDFYGDLYEIEDE